MEKEKSIILLSGPVGSGKSTIAQEIIKSSTEPFVYIEGDKFWLFFVKGFENRGLVSNFKTVMSSIIAAAVPYAYSGYEVIVDFSIPPWFLGTAKKIVSVRNVPLNYVVVRPTEEVCAMRAAGRKEGAIADYSRYHELYLSFDEAANYTIRNDSSSPEEIAQKIRKGLIEGKFLVTQ
jgi:hypothetical protein